MVYHPTLTKFHKEVFQMMKRVLGLVLTVCMLAGSAVAFASDPATEAWAVPFAETVTLTTVSQTSNSVVFPEGDSYENNVWIRDAKDRLNIEIVNLWTSADYDTSMNLAISSPETLPDFFRVTNQQFQQLYEAGLIADLTDVFEKHASARLKNLFASDESVVGSAMKDGRLYGLPRFSFGNNIDVPRFFWLRQDWMQQMGRTGIESIEHLGETLRLMNEQFGTKGMTFQKDLNELYEIAPSWHAYPKLWVTGQSGEIEWGGVQPEMKNFLAQMAAWYAEGLINPEFINMDWDASVEAVASGESGAIPFQQWAGWVHSKNSVDNNGPEAYLMPYMIPTVDGKQLLPARNFDNGDAIIVANAKSPNAAEALVKLVSTYQYILGDSYPSEFTLEQYQSFVNHDMEHLPGWAVRNALGEVDQYLQVQEAMKTGKPDNIKNLTGLAKYNETLTWINDKDSTGLGSATQLGFPEVSAYAQAYPFVQNNWFMNSRMWGPAPEAWLNLEKVLNDLLLEGYVRIITGLEPVEYFDTLVTAWYAAGGEQATAAVREMYQ
jgi:putative aldouronate transport system substrate-binding protein